MGRIFRFVALGAACCALFAISATHLVRALGNSQGAPQAPTFRSRLDLIRTEVAVIDNRTGKALTGLTESDFSVSENGVRQTISSFVDQSRVKSDDVSSASANAQRERRVFLFILAGGRDGPHKIYEGVTQFIRGRLEPNDLVAVMAVGRLTTLTTDHERIAAVVERLKSPPEALFDLRVRDRWQDIDTSPETERFIDSWLEPVPKGDALFRDAAALLLGTAEYRANDSADVVRTWKRRLGVNDVLKVVAGMEYLRRIEGEKHLVLVTVFGFNPPFTFANEGIGLHYYSADDDRRMAARANDAGIAVDIIQTMGPGLGLSSIMSSQNVAEHSGGHFSGNRTAEQQLQRIDDASRNAYVIGYVPANPTLDGKYRNIKITVNRKDVTVVYRQGYTANAAAEPTSSRDVYTRSRMRDAAIGNTDLTDIRLDLKASAVRDASSRQVRVDLTMDISTLPLTQNNGKWEGEIDLLLLLGDAKRNVVGKLEQRMTLSINQATYDKAKITGVPYSTVVPVTGSASVGKAIVYHFDTDKLGTATASVR